MKRTTFVLAVATLFTASDLTARQNGTGFWAGGGLGIGSARLTCRICDGPLASRRTVTTLQGRMGGTINQSITFGVEANGWREADEEEDVRQTFLGIGGAVYWYPSPHTARYYVKIGFGPVFYRADEATVEAGDDAATPVTSTAIGGHFGVGYEIPLAANLLFTPFFNFTGTMYGNLQQGDTELIGANPTLAQVGVGMTWRE
jgi:hypothetical protein